MAIRRRTSTSTSTSIRFTNSPVYDNNLAKSNELIAALVRKLPRGGNVKSVRVISLGGGLSGATVAVVFPSGNGTPDPIVVKIDRVERIEKEFDQYRRLVQSNIKPNERNVAQIQWPNKVSELQAIKKTGFDGETYSILAYTYAGGPRLESIGGFERQCRDLMDATDDQAADAVLVRCLGLLNNLAGTLKRVFYARKPHQGTYNSRFELPKLPWGEFLAVAGVLACSAPGWGERVEDLPTRWQERLTSTQSEVEYESIVTHGDLRCANILVVGDAPLLEPFLIDFGLADHGHPLFDLPRLEADILLRVVLPRAIHREYLREVVEQADLCPASWPTHTSRLFRLLAAIRGHASDLAQTHKIKEPVAEIYRLFLLGHATRFARLDDPALRGLSTRHDYVWFVLSLAERLLDPKSALLPLPLTADTARALSGAGISEVFRGPDRRNAAKRELLANHKGPIRLLAHTGNAFLNDVTDDKDEPEGQFYEALKQRLGRKKDNEVRIVLLNPFSVEGSKVAIAESRGALKGPELDVEFHEEHTHLFQKFRVCLKSYDGLKQEFGNRIRLRISHYATDASILLSEEAAFSEPYIVGSIVASVPSAGRANALETYAAQGTEAYQTAATQFEFMWDRAIDVEEFLRRRNEFREDFRRSERLRRSLVSLHESWFAVDPAVGCPNECKYCFLAPWGINKRKPYLFRSADEAYSQLIAYPYFSWPTEAGTKKDNDKEREFLIEHAKRDPRLPVPVACGNYTEMTDASEYALDLPTGGRGQPTCNLKVLIQLIDKHAGICKDLFREHSAPLPLCIITKRLLPRALRTSLQRLLEKHEGLRIAVFVSVSFLPKWLEPRVNHHGLLENFRIIRGINDKSGGGDGADRRIAGIHFWRPLLQGCPYSEPVENQARLVAGAGAVSSVAVGLKISERLGQQIRDSGGLRGTDQGEFVKIDPKNIPVGSCEYFPDVFRNAAIAAGEKCDHPVFLNTSCAVAHAFGRPDYNATFDGTLDRNEALIAPLMKLCDIQRRRWRVCKSADDRYRWLKITGEISQEVQTFVRQTLGMEVEANIRQTHEWRGSVAELRHGEICRLSHCPPAQRAICADYYKKSVRSTSRNL